jgi:hypothetical protein
VTDTRRHGLRIVQARGHRRPRRRHDQVELLAIMPEGAILSSRQAPNAVHTGEPYPHCDTGHLRRWMTAALADLGERFALLAIVPTSGAADPRLRGRSAGRIAAAHAENWPRFRRSLSRDVGACPDRVYTP